MNIMANQFEVERFKTIDANGHIIVYDGWGAGWRYETLLDKEPETIEWIDTFEPGDSFWDVGANIGIYSVYAAARGVQTLAFEPHFANYHQLCLSIALNGQQDVVTPLCLAFAQAKAVGQINLASIDVGTSMSNFGEALDFRGRPFDAAFRQGMIGYDIDSFIADFGLDVPTHLKIDVDGIELPIVEGARKTLANEKLVSASVELIETDEAQVSAVIRVMEEAGLHFVHKKQNAAFATAETTDVKNFLFHRDPVKYQRLTDERIAKIVAEHRAKYENEEADDGSVTTDQLIDQIVARIAAAPINGEPSPNLYMEDMLPAPVYQELLARLPDDVALDPIDHPDAIGADGKPTRYLLDLTRDSLARINPDDQPFWQAMIEVFTAPAIAEAIIAKFAPTLHERFGSALPELVAVPLLYRDLPGYRIGIHPDTPSKIATLQFYLPADDTQRHLGTSFHKRTSAGFERLKTNDFAPNAAYAFVRTDESWHSVDELGADEAPRNSIALTFYIKGQAYKSEPVAPNTSAAPSFIVNDVYDTSMGEALRLLAKSFSRREDVASLFLEGGTGVELGVAAGDFSERILNRSKIGYLYSIDMWAGDRGHDMQQYREAIARLSPHRDRNTILRMRFDDALPLFSDHALDFIYVDGYAHDGELDGATFRDWYPKLKSGGIIAGDDYHADWPLVVSAVDTFVAEYGLELHVIECSEADTWNSKYPTWFAMKP